MKKGFSFLIMMVMLCSLLVSALADTSPYIRYISSGKAVAGSAVHKSNTRVYVTQTSNVHTENGETGPKINSGARKSNTTKGSSICKAMSVSGYSGSTSASYTSTPASNTTIYLVVQPSKSTSSGQWEVSGTWSP